MRGITNFTKNNLKNPKQQRQQLKIPNRLKKNKKNKSNTKHSLKNKNKQNIHTSTYYYLAIKNQKLKTAILTFQKQNKTKQNNKIK